VGDQNSAPGIVSAGVVCFCSVERRKKEEEEERSKEVRVLKGSHCKRKGAAGGERGEESSTWGGERDPPLYMA